MKNPCSKNCEDRTAICHGTCEKYAAFAKWREEERARKQEEAKGNSLLDRYLRRRRATRRYYDNIKNK